MQLSHIKHLDHQAEFDYKSPDVHRLEFEGSISMHLGTEFECRFVIIIAGERGMECEVVCVYGSISISTVCQW